MPDRRSRSGRIPNLLDYPWHFVFITLAFTIRGYFLNPGLFALEQVLLYALVITGVVYGVFLIARRFLLLHHAGLLATLYALVFFSYGHIYEMANLYYQWVKVVPRAVVVNLPLIYIGFALLVSVLLYLQKRDFPALTTFLNVVAITLLIATVSSEFPIGAGSSNSQWETVENPALTDIQVPENLPENLPDVYYLILDGYPRADYLQSHYSYDNSAFITALEDLGFYVADDSVSNYTYTRASVGSTLNLDYIQNLADPDNHSYTLTTFLVDSRVALTFQEMGYQYIVVSSGFLTYSTMADLTIDVDSTGQLLYLDANAERPDVRRDYAQYLYRTTILRLLDPTLARLPGDVNSWESAERIAPQLEALSRIPAEDAPTFTLFHLTKPHPPIVLDRNGNRFFWVDFYETQVDFHANEEPHFADQLDYLNEEILKVIEHILETSPEPPIIIVQGDHGTQLARLEERTQLGNRPIAILNAYYFPDGDYRNLAEDITPINSFRVVFSQYFDIDYEKLPEFSYYYPYASVGNPSSLEFTQIAEGQVEPPYSPAD